MITQNIDGLHGRAGTRELVEVHGTISSSSCLRCRVSYPLSEVRGRQALDGRGVPRCDCGAPLKPDVVLFGEYLPVEPLERAQTLAEVAELMVCIGSSLEVYPVADLPLRTIAAGGRLAIVTRGPTPLDSRAAVRLDGDVVEELEAVASAIDLSLPAAYSVTGGG